MILNVKLNIAIIVDVPCGTVENAIRIASNLIKKELDNVGYPYEIEDAEIKN